MSTFSNPVNHTSPIVAGIVAVFALSIAGIIFRILFIRRMRAAAYANQNAFHAPLRQTFPMQRPPPPLFNPTPRNNFNPPPSWNRNNTHNNWNQPPPPYPQPRGPPPPASPPSSPRAARTTTRRSNPPTPPAPTIIVPQPASPTRPSNPSNPNPPSPPSNPSPPSPPSPPAAPAQPSRPDSASMSLVDRMREVQNLMLQIHNLERQPTSQTNREAIQKLQRRVTELSEVDSPAQQEPTDGRGTAPGPGPGPTVISAPVPDPAPAHEDGRSVAPNEGATNRREPPPYALDGRDD